MGWPAGRLEVLSSHGKSNVSRFSKEISRNTNANKRKQGTASKHKQGTASEHKQETAAEHEQGTHKVAIKRCRHVDQVRNLKTKFWGKVFQNSQLEKCSEFNL